MKFCTLGIIVVLLCSLPLHSSTDKDQKKALEAKAKALIEEGKTIEKQNRLLDARAKYAEAQGIIETRDGAKASYEVEREISKRAKKFLEEAKQAYNSGKYGDAQAALSQASDLEPGNASVSYNQALCYLKLSDRAKAVDSLNNAIHSVSDEKEKEKLTEFRDSLLTDENSGNLESVQKEKVKQVNELSLSLKNSSWRDTFTATDDPPLPNDALADPPEVAANEHVEVKAPDPAPAPRPKLAPTAAREDPQTTLCRKLSELKDILPQSPAIYFNLARCAELDGRTEESIQLFNKYLLIAPNALDTKDVQLRLEDLTALTGVSDKKGPDLRKLYADAARNLDLGRYERALQDYLKADSLIPNFPQTKRRLGLMYEMFGNIEKARDYFVAYKNLSLTTTDKADADAHLNGLNEKKEQYETSIKKADNILTELLDRWVGIDSAGTQDNNNSKGTQGRVTSNRTKAGSPVSAEYAQHQLELAFKQLQIAQSAFPLAPEGNELSGLALLLGQNGQAAQRHFDAVVSQHLPAYFFAGIRDSKDKKHSYLAKCELDYDVLRIIHLADYEPNHKQFEGPSKAAGQDQLGNLMTTIPGGPGDFEGVTLKTADLKTVETKNSLVLIKLSDRDLWLTPLNLTGFTPYQGPPARKFANVYTRLFRDDLGIEDAKLGKESLTSGEKVQIGLAFAGMAAGAAGASGLMGGTMSAMSPMFMNTSVVMMQTSTAYLQKSRGEEHEMLEANDYKLIPTEPFQLTFREDLR